MNFSFERPNRDAKIYKEECMYCFNNPESENGIFVSLTNFRGSCSKHIDLLYRKTGSVHYLHYIRHKSLKENASGDKQPEEKITKLGIGIDGGLQADEKLYNIEHIWTLVKYKDLIDIALTDPLVSPDLRLVCDEIIASDSAFRLQELESLAGTWDGSFRVPSKHSTTLLQLPDPPKIATSNWKCQAQNCEKTDNLWLNLTDGSIFCGRKFFDGSGGNHHAFEHYAVSKHPLAVKLGTITSHGADVYSYDEDDMVEDTKLSEHLKHFGINMMEMEKTEKTMLELELDLNQKYEWSALTEEGSKLQPVYGSGYTGMVNLGSSCYINSSIQTLAQIPDFQRIYVDGADGIFDRVVGDPAEDFNVQMAKVMNGLMSGIYSKPPPENDSEKAPKDNCIRPLNFRTLVGRGHAEFSSKRQQDTEEYLRYLFEKIEQATKNNTVGIQLDPVDSLRFSVEERTECLTSSKVLYKRRSEVILALPIPLSAATNKEEYSNFLNEKTVAEAEGRKLDPSIAVRQIIPLSACFEAFAADRTIDDFYSEAIKGKTMARYHTRIASFPDYLFVQVQKFTMKEDWTPAKLDVAIDVPDVIDLNWLRAKGLQSDEVQLPESDENAGNSNAPQINMDVVKQLQDMGFAENACKKAVYFTGNQGPDAAMNWVMEHMSDPDFGDPLPQLEQGATSGANADQIAMITALGFTEGQAQMALKNSQNNVEQAAEWLFMNPNAVPVSTSVEPCEPNYRDGDAKYQLVGFISHMGSSTSCGHYVCHLLKDGKWIIFNDEKVALSENPPRSLAYLYLFKRI